MQKLRPSIKVSKFLPLRIKISVNSQTSASLKRGRETFTYKKLREREGWLVQSVCYSWRIDSTPKCIPFQIFNTNVYYLKTQHQRKLNFGLFARDHAHSAPSPSIIRTTAIHKHKLLILTSKPWLQFTKENATKWDTGHRHQRQSLARRLA